MRSFFFFTILWWPFYCRLLSSHHQDYNQNFPYCCCCCYWCYCCFLKNPMMAKKKKIHSNQMSQRANLILIRSKANKVDLFFLLNCYNFSYREVSFIYNHNAYAILKTYLTGEKLIPHLFESWGQGYYYYYVDGCSTIYDIWNVVYCFLIYNLFCKCVHISIKVKMC